MELYHEMLLNHSQGEHAGEVRAVSVCPPFRRLLSRLPVLNRRQSAFNADRLFNRFWNYPRHLRRRLGEFDLFHVCDHSYAHLVHVLPPERTGVYCHDLDTFRCVLEPRSEPRPRWFRLMCQHILGGLQKAAVVFHSTIEVRKQIERYGVVDPARLVQACLGPAPEFGPEPIAPDPAANLIARLDGSPFLLHVGSCSPRKRIDVLLDVFAGVRKRCPDLKLVQVGGSWQPEHEGQIARLGIDAALVQVRGLERVALASLYRQAAMVLLPSSAEGFGFPVIEALACGAIVLASDIPVLREVGGSACVYCSSTETSPWVDASARILADPSAAPNRSLRLAQAGRHSWKEHVRTTLEAYRRLAQGLPPRS